MVLDNMNPQRFKTDREGRDVQPLGVPADNVAALSGGRISHLVVGVRWSPRAALLALDWLTDEERARADRFRRASDRDLFALARALARLLLQPLIGPRAWDWAIDSYGKPRVEGGAHFSLAHSGDWALCALSTIAEVGTDVERLRDDFTTIAEVMTPAERAWVATLPPRRRARAAFGLWARKEAWSKALGLGLRADLRTLETIPNGAGSSPMAFAEIPVDVRHVAALAARSDLKQLMHGRVRTDDLQRGPQSAN